MVGASVSGLFLWVLGILNLVVLVGILRVFRRMRHGEFDEQELEDAAADRRGFLNRFLGGLTRAVTRPWHIYPVGLLFGLGFDTATEVGLLVLAGGAAAFDLPFYAILVLPVLFAAGMCLMDTVDGVLMTGAYGWAFRRPVRKVYYNLTITAISVAVALVIGTIELVGVLADQVGIERGPAGGDRRRPPRRRRLRHRGPVRRRLGSAPWRSGASGGSRNAGRAPRPRPVPRTSDPSSAPSATAPACGVERDANERSRWSGTTRGDR